MKYKEKYTIESGKLLKEFKKEKNQKGIIVDFMEYRDWIERKLIESRLQHSVTSEDDSPFPDCSTCKEKYNDCKCESGGYEGDCEGTGV